MPTPNTNTTKINYPKALINSSLLGGSGLISGDLIIGAHGAAAAATLVQRTSRFTVILGLPEGKSSDALADVLIEHVHGTPELFRGSAVVQIDC